MQEEDGQIVRLSKRLVTAQIRGAQLTQVEHALMDLYMECIHHQRGQSTENRQVLWQQKKNELLQYADNNVLILLNLLRAVFRIERSSTEEKLQGATSALAKATTHFIQAEKNKMHSITVLTQESKDLNDEKNKVLIQISKIQDDNDRISSSADVTIRSLTMENQSLRKSIAVSEQAAVTMTVQLKSQEVELTHTQKELNKLHTVEEELHNARETITLLEEKLSLAVKQKKRLNTKDGDVLLLASRLETENLKLRRQVDTLRINLQEHFRAKKAHHNIRSSTGKHRTPAVIPSSNQIVATPSSISSIPRPSLVARIRPTTADPKRRSNTTTIEIPVLKSLGKAARRSLLRLKSEIIEKEQE